MKNFELRIAKKSDGLSYGHSESSVSHFLKMAKQKFILTEDSINGTKLNDKIRDEELHEFSIIHRESFIDELIGWISEVSRDKELMKQDLKELMSWTDEYILTSNSTNHYIGIYSSDYEETCAELLELNKTL